MKAARICAAGAAWGIACAFAADLPASTPPDRGAELYELRCGGCHGQSVHSREKRVAADFRAVREWVERWNAALGGQWSPDEVSEVTIYLNRRYYRFACPPTDCKVVSVAGAIEVD